ncbi:baseplate J/gp47 family protein [Cytobacillus firmus]|uniref:baseplate J/gp47 family protein n=1 Tax=Cytobacillus firmus TaxID=1399 RepID=UPI0018CD416F|nr:baseplate J/gp47 family protein [Cytobacillus firmus]MBG9548508.1 baseplate J protein [Cytobacillus firmus]MBG9602931.1 baseplate J protein [Cytobacillus firmus]MBG9654884.1 baseplate J protein [Cytobacillus firmus]MED1906108.1 baseplate J/gp47 family protein [Cytobacillus firmus]MED1941523.1 baseplate J/gp47 family protein [Cytobacillus firmus]
MAYEDKTPESLHQALLENVDDAIDKREGSVTHDLTYPAAIELSNAYVELDAVLLLGFAETTEGSYLDMRAMEHGVTRKPAVKAQGSVTFSGPNSTIIPAGTRIQTTGSEPVFFVTKGEVTIASGTASVAAEAEAGGVSGNVAQNTITALAAGPLYGIVTVNNPASFDGGSDMEDDASLLQRLKDRVQKPATSGNANQYRQWALEVAGVGDAKVYPVWNGGGTVKVVLLDTEKTAPTQSVIDATIAHIEANRPIGASVTVVGASELPINVSATLTLASGAEMGEVQTQFIEALSEYLQSVAFTGDLIRYTRIANLLLDVPPIIDYANLTVNGGMINIQPTDDQVGIVGTVNFS